MLTNCGAEMSTLMKASDEDIGVIERTIAERMKDGVSRKDAEIMGVREAIAQLRLERGRVKAAIAEQHPDLKAPAKVEPVAEKPVPAPENATVAKSAEKVDPNAPAKATAQDFKDAAAHIDKVLGPKTELQIKPLLHAGEFERVNGKDIIRISVHAANPLGTAYHESIHNFFVKLKDQGNEGVIRAMQKFATSAPVLNQLRRLLKGEDAALKQLSDPEEAAAYAYQFWAAGQLKVGDGTKNIFQKIAAMVRKAFGVWSTDERAETIMNYFHSGEFKANEAQPSAVAKALVEAGRNQAIEKAKSFTKPLADLSDALLSTGSERLNGTGIPALRELARAMKLGLVEQGSDQGFIPASRASHTRVMNWLNDKLGGYTEAQMDEAMKAMQTGGTAASPEARLVQRIIQGPNGLLQTTLKFMKDAGVDIGKIQPRDDYFPRVYDTSYISRHQAEFVTVLEKHGIDTKEATGIVNKLTANDGMPFNVETDKPGNQFLKMRKLWKIPDAELEPFMRKNLYEVMNSYVTQATRRAEWARRFKDDGSGIHALLDKAKAQGATPKDLAAAEKYVKAVDGTLGDDLNPTMRRVMGNMLVYQNLRLLPLMIFSSAVDPMGIMVRGGTMGDAWGAFKRGVKEVRNNFRTEFGPDDGETQLAKAVGAIDDQALAHTLGTSFSQGIVGDTGRKINDALFRYNLADSFNRSMRVAATGAALRFMERHADGTASKHSERWMAELGYQPGEFKPGQAMDDKAKAAINRWVDGAVLRPDAADKALWMSDPHYMLVSHLKQFVFAFQQTIIKRVAHEAAEGNYAPAMALSSYVPIMVAADAIKGMIQGGGSTPSWKQDWGPADYLENGIERGGLYGIGQFAVDTGEGVSHSGVLGAFRALAGPTIDQLADGVEVLAGREQAGSAALHALPANALYSGFVKGQKGQPDPKFAD